MPANIKMNRPRHVARTLINQVVLNFNSHMQHHTEHFVYSKYRDPNQNRKQKVFIPQQAEGFQSWRRGGKATEHSLCPYPASPCDCQTPCRAESTFPLAVLEPACRKRQGRSLLPSDVYLSSDAWPVPQGSCFSGLTQITDTQLLKRRVKARQLT